jgi:uncharacterized protein YjiS (DUF1127 family)
VWLSPTKSAFCCIAEGAKGDEIMTAKSTTFETFDTPSRGAHLSAFGALVRGRFAEAVAAWKDVVEVRTVCKELTQLNDRMLLDIGVTPEEIARLRAGDRFLPGRYLE